MKRTAVESSVIRSAGHDRSTAVLELEFTSGDVYRYFAVPARVFDELMDAGSPGRYFSERVRDVYPFEQVR